MVDLSLAKVLGVDKLLDYTASGIGAVAGPMLAPWRARRLGIARVIEAGADAEAMKIAAQAQANSLRIIEDAQIAARSSLRMTDAEVEGEISIGERIEQSVQYREAKRLANLGAIVGSAAEQLGDAEVPDEEPDHDWTARFFDYAQDVSSEDMQTLWAKVLAGEVERPGSTSGRTLSVLRDLDSATARLFASICALSLFTIPTDGNPAAGIVVSLDSDSIDDPLVSYGIGYVDLTRLDEHGLIAQFGAAQAISIKRKTRLGSRISRYQFGSETWRLIATREFAAGESIRLAGVMLTKTAHELSTVVTPAPHAHYNNALAKHLASLDLMLVRESDTRVLGLPDLEALETMLAGRDDRSRTT